MNAAVYTYLAYLAISVSITIWVAKTLHKNGRIFLVDSFNGNKELADSVNHLLVVGFYLINIGFVSMALKTSITPEDAQQGIEVLSKKIGWVLVILGIMHFINIAAFSRMRDRGLRRTPPPIPLGHM
jgi:hypothetical protein